jgi:glycerol-3-phosphate dehydrogenase
VHLVFPHEKLPLHRAITLISPVDGRVMFAIPWRERTVVGTTDTDFDGTADDVHADAADAAYLCESANGYFPRAKLEPRDVIATWAGLRPLIRPDDARDESDVSREHEVFVRDDGIVIIAGGKLTTYRRMAREAVRAAVKWLRGNDDGFTDELGKALIDQYKVEGLAAAHLCGVYGVRAHALGQAIAAAPAQGERLNPDLPYVWAEIDFAVTHDLARTVDDVLSRRVPLLLTGRDQGLDVAAAVADRMGRLLGWSDDEVARQLAAYHAVVADSRRFRSA